MKKRSVGIIGSGAVGAYYGALLARAGKDVHFLLRSDYDHVQEHGLKIISKDGDFELAQINAWASAEAMPLMDLVLVATKTVSNELIVDLLSKSTKLNAQVIILQNGLGVEAELAKALPDRQFFGGLCFLCSSRLSPGVIHHQAYGKIKLAEYYQDQSSEFISSDLEELGAYLNTCGLTIELEAALTKARWQKLVWNMTFNGLCTVLACTTGEIMEDPRLKEQARDLMLEVQLGARACGYEIEDAFLDEMMLITEHMKPYKPSMYLDYEAGRALELEDIYRRPLDAVKLAGQTLPKLESLYGQLVALGSI